MTGVFDNWIKCILECMSTISIQTDMEGLKEIIISFVGKGEKHGCCISISSPFTDSIHLIYS